LSIRLSARGILLPALALLALSTGCQDPAAQLDAHVEQAEAALAEARFEEAASQFTSALGIDPERADVHLGLARSLLFGGQASRVAGELEENVRLGGDPEQAAELYALLASTYTGRGDLVNARAASERALELDPELLTARRSLVDLYLELGEAERAEELARDLLERSPADAETKRLLVHVLLLRGLSDEAAVLAEGIPSAERDAPAHYALAMRALARGEVEEARLGFEACLEQAPTHPEVLRALIQLDIAEDRALEGVARIQKALSQAPDDARLLLLTAELALVVGDVRTAEVILRKAIELDPNDLANYRELAVYVSGSKRASVVLGDYRKKVASDPWEAWLQAALGRVYQATGQPNEALSHYQEALRLDPTLAAARTLLARLLAEHDAELDIALELALSARAELVGQAETSDTVGYVLYKRREPDAALPFLIEAEQMLPVGHPARGEVRLHLALTYESAGDSQRARVAAEQAWQDLQMYRDGLVPRPDPAWAPELEALRLRLD
jgi:tetratricopeptide (TPR) repeat protein